MGKKIYNIISAILILVMVVVAILLIGNRFNMPGSVKLYVVQSGSMEPAIHTGSIVITGPEKDYRIGDIITFGPDTKAKPPTTHRIKEIRVATGNPLYTTKGDANNAVDTKEINKTDIIGEVKVSIPYLGYALVAAKKPYGFLFLVIIPAFILAHSELKKIGEEIKKMRAKRAAKKKSEDSTKEPKE